MMFCVFGWVTQAVLCAWIIVRSGNVSLPSNLFHSITASLILEPLLGPLQAETLIITSPDINQPLLCSTLSAPVVLSKKLNQANLSSTNCSLHSQEIQKYIFVLPVKCGKSLNGRNECLHFVY